ncbi:MAG: SPOR domain-containing protein [Erythrobacter sp.]|nr:SPOR domain-containing protein [Erythrobacter sp.]
MDSSIRHAPRIALAVSTALAGLALAGCTTTSAPQAGTSFASAQTALTKGQVGKAIMHAEAAVLAEPRNPGYRALLGASYLEAGRFQSAAASFGDALDLGDENPRTVLSFALAKIALGEGRAATAVLDEYAQAIDQADLGLALALAGQPERGVHVLVNAVRASEEVSPKLRQNLAYTYALSGNWRAARVMAAEDVPAGEVDQRMTQWAAMSAPEAFQQRIAALLNVTPQYDAGQPQRLALANFPSQEMMVAEAAAQAPVEMMAEAKPEMMAKPAPVATFAQAFEAPAPSVETVAAPGTRFVSNPVVQQLPARAERSAPRAEPRMAAASSQRRMAPAAAPAAAPVASDKSMASHLVQLGSYDSKAEAERGWTMLNGKFPQLKDHKVVITEAVVNGRTFWRVAADGFGPKSAQSLCSTVKSAGRGCFAYAASSPPAGAVKGAVQMASRSK